MYLETAENLLRECKRRNLHKALIKFNGIKNTVDLNKNHLSCFEHFKLLEMFNMFLQNSFAEYETNQKAVAMWALNNGLLVKYVNPDKYIITL